MSKKFKFHWGWATLLVYATFMTVFLYYFYKSFQELKTNELVTQDYYEKELSYGDVLAKKQNADTMRVPVKIIQIDKGIVVEFPKYISYDKISGSVNLYKPDNKALDKKIDLKLDENNQMKIDKTNFISGRWNINIDWKQGDTSYYKEEKITIK